MQDQIASLAARLNEAQTPDQALSIACAAHHTRAALETQHRRVRDGILKQLAEIMTEHEQDRARLRKLETDADQKAGMLASAKQEEAA